MSQYAEFFDAFKKANSNLSAVKAQEEANKIWHELKEKHPGKGKKVDFQNAVKDKIEDWKQWATRRRSSNLQFWLKLPSGVSAQSRGGPTDPCTSASAGAQGSVRRTVESGPAGPAGSSGPATPPGPAASEGAAAVTEGPDDAVVIEGCAGAATGADEHSAAGDSPVRSGAKRKSVRIVTSSDEEGVDDVDAPSTVSRQYSTPAQDALKQMEAVLLKKIDFLVTSQDAGLAGPGSQKEIEKLRSDLKGVRQTIKMKATKAAWQRKNRKKTRNALANLVQNQPELRKTLSVRDAPGRPRLEEDQPGILETIVKIVSFGGAADERRRSPLLRSCRTLSDLTLQLQEKYDISRSAVYVRVLPKNSHAGDGKRHVQTVPVKLCKAQADARKDHPDGRFCTASIRSVEELVSILGEMQCVVISQDDKSRVPIGITAANKQAPLLMHLEYRVRLADHDFAVAAGHKLIPSVYAGIKILEGKIGDPKVVSYSGPLYTAIRSGKHCSSTAASHAHDFERLMELETFKDLVYKDFKVKPVFVIFSDGGPDENPRYPKVISHAIDHFQKYDLDALFLLTNAPGRSAYNRVERCMAPLSREMSGLVLPHDHFGSHLSVGGVTIDKELELRNFKFAGETLAEVWNQVVIDGYPVTAEYVGPGGEAPPPFDVTDAWYASHVRESQYCLQIVKCGDPECCGEWRSSLRDILPFGFLPPPFPLRRNPEGRLIIPQPQEIDKDFFPGLTFRQGLSLRPDFPEPLQYDRYCSSVQGEIEGRTCNVCGLYFASKKSKVSHTKSLHAIEVAEGRRKAKRVLAKRDDELLCLTDDRFEPEIEWLDSSEVDVNIADVTDLGNSEEAMPIVNFDHFLSNPWTTDVLSD